MKRYKDIHKGQRLFVMGNGFSLSQIPLHLLENEFSFGINRVGMLFGKTTWRPTFFFCITHRVKWSMEYKRDVLSAIEASSKSFIGKRISSDIGVKYSQVHYIEALHIGKEFSNPENSWWDRDISDGKISVYGQSLFGVMRIAVYMGFNPIYLLGLDGYTPKKGGADTNHFDPNYELPEHRHTVEWFKYELPRIKDSHRMIYEGTKRMGVGVFDATTVENNLPYPKVTLEEIW